MALTRPTLAQLTTGIARISDPLVVVHSGQSVANVDIGFIMNRNNGTSSNVALFWNESANTFVTSFTSNTGESNTNIAITSYANVTTGNVLPGANVTYSLGSPTQRWKDLWLSGTTIYLGGASISSLDTNTVSITNQNGGSFAVTGSAPGQATGSFGNLTATSGLASTNTTTGALQVTGGVGISGAVYAGGLGSFAGGVKTSAITSASSSVSLYADGSQTAIGIGSSGVTTTVTGTLTATGAFNASSVTATGTITAATLNAATIGNTGATLTGTLQTAAQTNITSVGTLTGLTVSGATNLTGALTLSSSLSAGGTTGTNGYVLSTTGSGVLWVPSGGFTGGVVTNPTTFNSAVTLANLNNSTSSTTGALIVAGGVGIAGDVNIAGTLFVANLQARGSTNIVVQDPMTYFQANVLYPWTYDTGLYSDSIGGVANTYVHHGMVRNSLNGVWGFFSNVKSEPAQTINWTDAGLIWDPVKSGELYLANTTTSSSTTTGALQVAGGAGIAGAVYAGSVYDSGNRVLSTSSGAGNLSISGTAVTLPASGPGATSAGSSTAIPVLTTDAYGRLTSLTTTAVVAPAGTLSGSTLASGVTGSSLTGVGTITSGTWNGTAVGATYGGTGVNNGSYTITLGASTNINQNLRTTDSPTFVGATFSSNVTRSSRAVVTNYSGNVAPSSPIMGDEWFRGNTGALYKYLYDNVSSTYNWVNISSALYNVSTSAVANSIALRDGSGNLTATNFIGVASSAKYADLAEIYTSDKEYEPGTVVVFGGKEEITTTKKTHDTRVAGVISTDPAYLMNSEASGLPVAFTGRVPCKVRGPVSKGDVLVSSAHEGYAERMMDVLYRPGCILGKALGEVTNNEFATIEVVVGRF